MSQLELADFQDLQNAPSCVRIAIVSFVIYRTLLPINTGVVADKRELLERRINECGVIHIVEQV